LAENGVDYVRAFPSALIGDDPDDLLAEAGDHWPVEGWLAQLGWMTSLGPEGGLFVMVGRRTTADAGASRRTEITEPVAPPRVLATAEVPG
jgi:hypothetical protein